MHPFTGYENFNQLCTFRSSIGIPKFRMQGLGHNFSELMKINIMIFFTYVIYFSRKCMSDHKGFSLYNESGSKHVLKLS